MGDSSVILNCGEETKNGTGLFVSNFVLDT